MSTEHRLIDANEAYEIAIASGRHNDFARGRADLTSLQEVFEDCTTVDAVEVVRCKACKHSALYEDGTIFCKLHSEQGEKEERSGSYSVWMEPDDFCSYGERRTDG